MTQVNAPNKSLRESSSSLFEGFVPFAMLFTAMAWFGFWIGYELFWSPPSPGSNLMLSLAHDKFWELVSSKYKLPLKVVLGIIFAGTGFLMGIPLGYAIKQRRIMRSGATTALVLVLVLLSVLSGETLLQLYRCKAHFGYYDLIKAWELFCSPFPARLGKNTLALIFAIISLLLRAVVGLTIYFAAQRGLVAPVPTTELAQP